MQLKSLIDSETDLIANLANASALIFYALKDINWAGFYFLKENVLVLGPFQGKPACVRLPIGKGVCSAAVESGKTVVVADVHAFKGHIACDSASLSEIVVPLHKDGKIFAVMDIDSPVENRFERDREVIEELAKVLEEKINRIPN